MIWLAVALAGALGATARYLADHLVSVRLPGVLPWGTFLINVSGSFLAGIVTVLTAEQVLSPEVSRVVAGGFLGAYTTFSTAMYESVRLLEDGARRQAVTNLALPLVSAVGAAALGWQLGALLLPR